LVGLPPTLIHVGELEALLDDSRILVQEMQAQGCDVAFEIYAGMWHVWQAFGGRIQEADRSLGELGKFLRSRLMDGPL
jgi:acetyl esterase/lipase